MTNNIRYGRKHSGIKRELKAKIDEWLDTIKDEEVRKLAAANTIITGGAIASMLLGEQVNDYDVYFRDKETTLAVAKYYVSQYNKANKPKAKEYVTSYTPEVREETLENIKGEKEDRVVIFIKSAGITGEDQTTYDYFENRSESETQDFVISAIKKNRKAKKKNRYKVTFLSDNAITLTNKIQLVIRFYGEPEKIYQNFDFSHAACWYDYHTNNLELPAEALECLLSRTLIYRGSLYPIASIFRMKKFIERGWRITAGQQLKIMWQISELDLTDHNVLREQLIGVDMAYMFQLIEALKDIDTNKLNSSYIATVIDRIFD